MKMVISITNHAQRLDIVLPHQGECIIARFSMVCNKGGDRYDSHH